MYFSLICDILPDIIYVVLTQRVPIYVYKLYTAALFS